MNKDMMLNIFGGTIENNYKEKEECKNYNECDIFSHQDITINKYSFWLPLQYIEDMKIVHLLYDKGMPITVNDWDSNLSILEIAQQKIKLLKERKN